MVFDDVISGGVAISNPDFTFELEEFQVSIALSQDGTEVESTLTGGVGPFNSSWTTPDGSTVTGDIIDFQLDGCYSITVTDLTTSCTTSTSDYIYTENIGLGLDAIGDLDNDGLINATDLLEFLGDFGTSSGDPSWSSITDFNCDGIVNTFDLLFFLSVFPG